MHWGAATNMPSALRVCPALLTSFVPFEILFVSAKAAAKQI
jgi:hypothetical protein